MSGQQGPEASQGSGRRVNIIGEKPQTLLRNKDYTGMLCLSGTWVVVTAWVSHESPLLWGRQSHPRLHSSVPAVACLCTVFPHDRVGNSLTLSLRSLRTWPCAQRSLKIPQDWHLPANLHLAEANNTCHPQRPFPQGHQEGDLIYLPSWYLPAILAPTIRKRPLTPRRNVFPCATLRPHSPKAL